MLEYWNNGSTGRLDPDTEVMRFYPLFQNPRKGIALLIFNGWWACWALKTMMIQKVPTTNGLKVQSKLTNAMLLWPDPKTSETSRILVAATYLFAHKFLTYSN
jgi:hypothetical protein